MAEEEFASGGEHPIPESLVSPPNPPFPASKAGMKPLLLKPECKIALSDFIVCILIRSCLKTQFLILSPAHILLFDMARQGTCQRSGCDLYRRWHYYAPHEHDFWYVSLTFQLTVNKQVVMRAN